jgi:hypothetical protein
MADDPRKVNYFIFTETGSYDGWNYECLLIILPKREICNSSSD